jgi:type VI secretion system protein VasJ
LLLPGITEKRGRRTISDLSDKLSALFTGANPTGENINYDTDFDTIKTEMGKLGNIDYELIDGLCEKLLKEKSKDVRLFCFMGFVAIRNSSWERLADVFQAFAQLAEQNYDGLFPDRPRAKQQAIQWMCEPRFNENLADKKPEEKDFPHIERLNQSLARLKAALAPKFPEGSPFPPGLASAAATWEKMSKPKPQPAGTASGVAVPGSGGAAAPAETMETPRQAQTNAKKTAYFLIEKEPQRIMGYRLMRALRWDILEKAPPSENGKTQLAAPPAELVNSLTAALASNDFKGALDKAEVAFTSGANYLWLGLQRIASAACKGLGQPYSAVNSAILFETGHLLKRIPEMMTLCFSDGSMFCDDATKDWINREVTPLFSAGGAAAPAAAGAAEDPVEAEKKEATAFAASGSVEKALDLIQTAIRNSGSERDNFRRSIILGTMLMSAKQPDIALSILESLNDKINNYHIDKWDPDLAVEAWSAMVKALKAAKAGKAQNVLVAMSEKMNVIISKISQIDPKKAFSLTT